MMAQQKRSAAEADNLLCGVSVIVFDIEGTMTPITFVKVFMHRQAVGKFCFGCRHASINRLTHHACKLWMLTTAALNVT